MPATPIPLASSAPPVRNGQTLDYEGLRKEAEAAVDASGLTQTELAERLDVAQATLSRALNMAGGRYARLQRLLVALLTEYEVSSDPLFRVNRKGA